jgi:CO/xanthine dehydrogenase FAD-binding subunit
VALETYLQDGSEGKVTTLRVEVGEMRWGTELVARTPADEPIVAAFAVVELDADVVRQARVALVGVWQEPVRLAQAPAQLVGGPLDAATIEAVAQAVAEEVSPKGDFLGGEEYRRAMAGVLTHRALEACLRQEVGDE